MVVDADAAFTVIKSCFYCTDNIPIKVQTPAKCAVVINGLRFTIDTLIQLITKCTINISFLN